jgi:hypothetical protein
MWALDIVQVFIVACPAFKKRQGHMLVNDMLLYSLGTNASQYYLHEMGFSLY